MDPVANMLTSIRNAMLNREAFVVVPFSKFKGKILHALKDKKYIKDFEELKQDNIKQFKITLNYDNKKPTISHIKKVSKPGLRVYTDYTNIPRPLQGIGTVILSTSSGVMSGSEARKKKIGGEIICEVY
jgi:small subunit ribosomal protein S8